MVIKLKNRKMIYYTKFISLLIILAALFFSCKKDVNFSFVFKNSTGYKIDNIEFSCAVDKKSITISPNSTSENFTLKYRKKIGRFFTEPLLCVTVLRYSDSLKTYENTIGQTFSIKKLSETNEFVIELNTDSSGSSGIFKIVKM